MRFAMNATIRMNRAIDINKDFISPGSYTIISDDKPYTFDFYASASELDKQDPCVVHIAAEDLDYDAFPEAVKIDKQVLSNITKISEFFIYTGEPDGSNCASPVELMEMFFTLEEPFEHIVVPKEVVHSATVSRGF